MTNENKYQIIIDAISEDYCVPKEALLTPSHARLYSEPRYVIFYFGRKKTGLSLMMMAAMFKRDHSSASHGISLIENLILVNGMGKKITKLDAVIDAKFAEFRRVERKAKQTYSPKDVRRRNHFRAMFRKSRMVKRLILAG